MSRINFRVSEDLKRAFEADCQQQGKSMSEALKEHIRETTGHTSTGRLPDDPQLAKAYETIYWLAGGRPVDVDDAESAVSNKLNIPKDAVRGRVIRPLEKRGYVTLRRGISKVRYRPNVDLEAAVSDPTEEGTA